MKAALDFGEQPAMILRADILPAGGYGDAWFIVTDRAFLAVSADHLDKVEVRRIPLTDVKAVCIHNFVGNSIVELDTYDGRIEAARCTRALVDRFAEALPRFREIVREAAQRDEAKHRRAPEKKEDRPDTDEETIQLEAPPSAMILSSEIFPEHPEEERGGRRGGERGEGRPPAEREGPPIFRRVRCEKCNRAMPEGVTRCPYCSPKAAILFRSFHFIKPFWPWVTLVFVLTVSSSALRLVQPQFQRIIVDDAIKNGNRAALLTNWLGWIAAFVVALLISGVREYISQWLGQRVILNLRAEVYRHLQRLALSFYERRTTGNLMTRVTSDTDRLLEFLSTWLPDFVQSVLLVIGIGAIVIWFNWQLALASLVSIPIMVILTYYLMRWLRRVYHKAWRYLASLSSLLSDAIPGVKVVRAFAQEDREIDRFDHRSHDYYDQNVRAIKVHAVYSPAIEFLIMGGTMVVWLYGGNMVISDAAAKSHLTLGVLLMFVSYVVMFYGPVRTLASLSRMVQRGVTSADRVFEVLDTEPTIRNAANPIVKSPIEAAIEFENVWFRYEEGEPVLKNISFSVKPGEMIGLAGPSGAGKSTLVNLIARFYDVTSGRILVDGIDIKNLEIRTFRDQIGMVLQDPFLFTGTIGMNIGYGKVGATSEEIISSAKAANAHDFIIQFPDAYDTEVGERGVRLSGGERQRVSIARAILKNPRILILDEATSSVDTETEAKIQEAVERLVENRTTFAIAHRLSTLKRADRLLILTDGELVEQGTHDELMKLDGVYANLCRMQAELARVRAL